MTAIRLLRPEDRQPQQRPRAYKRQIGVFPRTSHRPSSAPPHRVSPRARQTVNELPHPQPPLALGFWKVKP
jgi:hypothetical protein